MRICKNVTQVQIILRACNVPSIFVNMHLFAEVKTKLQEQMIKQLLKSAKYRNLSVAGGLIICPSLQHPQPDD